MLFGLVLIGAGLGGCGDSTGPLAPPGTLPGGGTGGGSGQSGSPSGADLLVGTWERTVVVQASGDVQRWTTRWHFGEDATCWETRESYSLAEGFPITRTDPCTWSADGFQVTIRFQGQPDSVVFDYSFAAFSPDRLVLDGLGFQRIA